MQFLLSTGEMVDVAGVVGGEETSDEGVCVCFCSCAMGAARKPRVDTSVRRQKKCHTYKAH
jgi:hypothetical protein